MVDEGFVRYMSALLPRFVGALPAPDIEQIVDRLQRVHMASGEILYRQGDAGDCMHFVVTGRLEVWVTDKYGERRHWANGRYLEPPTNVRPAAAPAR